MGQSKSSSQSPSTRSSKDGSVNFSNRGSETEGFWVLATKSGRKEMVQDNSLTLLADARASKKGVFQVRCLSEANFRGSTGG